MGKPLSTQPHALMPYPHRTMHFHYWLLWWFNEEPLPGLQLVMLLGKA